MKMKRTSLSQPVNVEIKMYIFHKFSTIIFGATAVFIQSLPYIHLVSLKWSWMYAIIFEKNGLILNNYFNESSLQIQTNW